MRLVVKVFAVHLCPDFFMGVAAALRREAELELRLLAVGNLRIQIGTVYACAVSVAALLDNIPYFVLADIFEHKDVAQVCIETLHQDVCLPVSQMGSPVHRTAVTVGAFFTQVIGEFDLDSLPPTAVTCKSSSYACGARKPVE